MIFHAVSQVADCSRSDPVWVTAYARGVWTKISPFLAVFLVQGGDKVETPLRGLDALLPQSTTWLVGFSPLFLRQLIVPPIAIPAIPLEHAGADLQVLLEFVIILHIVLVTDNERSIQIMLVVETNKFSKRIY